MINFENLRENNNSANIKLVDVTLNKIFKSDNTDNPRENILHAFGYLFCATNLIAITGTYNSSTQMHFINLNVNNKYHMKNAIKWALDCIIYPNYSGAAYETRLLAQANSDNVEEKKRIFRKDLEKHILQWVSYYDAILDLNASKNPGQEAGLFGDQYKVLIEELCMLARMQNREYAYLEMVLKKEEAYAKKKGENSPLHDVNNISLDEFFANNKIVHATSIQNYMNLELFSKFQTAQGQIKKRSIKHLSMEDKELVKALIEYKKNIIAKSSLNISHVDFDNLFSALNNYSKKVSSAKKTMNEGGQMSAEDLEAIKKEYRMKVDAALMNCILRIVVDTQKNTHFKPGKDTLLTMFTEPQFKKIGDCINANQEVKEFLLKETNKMIIDKLSPSTNSIYNETEEEIEEEHENMESQIIANRDVFNQRDVGNRGDKSLLRKQYNFILDNWVWIKLFSYVVACFMMFLLSIILCCLFFYYSKADANKLENTTLILIFIFTMVGMVGSFKWNIYDQYVKREVERVYANYLPSVCFIGLVGVLVGFALLGAILFFLFHDKMGTKTITLLRYTSSGVAGLYILLVFVTTFMTSHKTQEKIRNASFTKKMFAFVLSILLLTVMLTALTHTMEPAFPLLNPNSYNATL
ncbi:hypothetical protein NEFER03_0808 [Nematocida sp. LUAm3]|nr:hypothetical protein NEFER03_0808 [Nematocida sp. LUAm3]KAI5174826.1 hypothetical protein NEFER02_0926 [Nematocida sp. LUAm2]KAI5177576.1 hypothetical protein NEFER01_0826 [Nematocida sp. LUAm1]